MCHIPTRQVQKPEHQDSASSALSQEGHMHRKNLGVQTPVDAWCSATFRAARPTCNCIPVGPKERKLLHHSRQKTFTATSSHDECKKFHPTSRQGSRSRGRHRRHRKREPGMPGRGIYGGCGRRRASSPQAMFLGREDDG